MNFFDEMAGVWNKTCRYDTGRIEKVLSVLQLKQGDTVLDIGTGTGVMIPFIREQVGHYAPIVAVDSSEKMLREASLRFPNAGVRFVRADVERDRLGGRFNAILLYSVFPHFRYPVDTIARLVTDNPNFYISLACMILGTQLFLAGFVAELVSRSATDRNVYLIEKEIWYPFSRSTHRPLRTYAYKPLPF